MIDAFLATYIPEEADPEGILTKTALERVSEYIDQRAEQVTS